MPPNDIAVSRVLGPPISHHHIYSPASAPLHQPSTSQLVDNLQMPSNAPVLVWFRGHDLRTHDHVALDAAIERGAPVVALYVLERGAETDGLASFKHSYLSSHSTQTHSTLHKPVPVSPNGSFSLGRVQRWYLHHSLSVLRHQLSQIGITLVLRRVDSANDTAVQVATVARALGASAVFWNKRYKPRAYPVDNAVRIALRNSGVAAHDFLSETLMEPTFSYHARFSDFQSYNRYWINAMRESPPPRPKRQWKSFEVCALSRKEVQRLLEYSTAAETEVYLYDSSAFIQNVLPEVQDLELLEGLNIEGKDSPGDINAIGCVAAKEALNSFLAGERFNRFASGVARRDGMVTGAHLVTSRLSPHVRFGEISPRVVFYAVVDAGAEAKERGNLQGLEASRTYLRNMSLREFGYYMLSKYPSAAWKPIMPEFEAFPWVQDEDGALMHAWETGTTGFPIVDAAMRQLIREGWIHNRMRFLAASFFCKYLLLPWPLGAAHMVRTLVDGDEACNSLGWQWTAGCNSDSFPFSTLVNPVSLYTQCQSSKSAADYVRKYVPELSSLPDHLVFAPWKATPAQCEKYDFTIVSRAEFRDVNSRWSPSRTLETSNVNVYPSRVVNGADARYRARNAMEVMRRIFSAQRQCRTIVVEQSDPVAMGKKREVDVVEIQVLEDASQVTLSSTDEREKGNKRGHGRMGNNDGRLVGPSKRSRLEKTLSGSNSDVASHVSNVTSGIPRFEVDLLLSSSEAPRNPANRNRKRAGEDRSPSPQSGEASVGRSDAVQKRPRSSGQEEVSPDKRLSVRSLITPQLPSTPHPKSVKNNDFVRRYRELQREFVQPPQPQQGVIQTPQIRSHRPAASPDIISNFQSPGLPSIRTPDHGHSHDTARVLHSPHLSASPQLTTLSPQINSPSPSPTIDLALKNQFQQTPRVDINGRQSVTYGGVLVGQVPDPVSDSLRQQQDSGSVIYPTHPGVDQGSHLPGMVLHPPQQKGAILQQGETSNAGRAGAGNTIHPQGMHQIAVLPDHFQAQNVQATQMIMPFRGTGSPIVGPQGGVIHSHNGAQRYFAVPTGLGMQSPRTPNQSFMWYPAVSPLMDMRVSGIPGSPMPHLMPHLMQPPGAVPVGYTSPGGGSHPTTGLVPHPGTQSRYSGAGPSTRRGPTNAMERLAIARRMAAMDYYDEAYGGKHWEQWQAIALHLLDQYEFSEDTDRETSKAYTRLCVLKDELRDANPQGPRVTVNHCKEVFRILCLPVTGEWDRRGHGGVRGPYCYGCVKRSSVQVPRN